jgi:phosphoribosylanthranilate isomerase
VTPVTIVKMCGMTRAQDVAHAAALGVGYVGCVFVPGPRQRTASQAATVFEPLEPLSPGRGPLRAGVFGSTAPRDVVDVVAATRLDVVQLHGDPTVADVVALRSDTRAEIWAVLRCRDGRLPASAGRLWDAGDALLLDAHVPGALGGTGVPLPWARLADQMAALRSTHPGRSRLVLAGGLTPENVGRAIELLHPDIVDVSSGVESAPGIKDHARMRAFVDAVAAAARPPSTVLADPFFSDPHP